MMNSCTSPLLLFLFSILGNGYPLSDRLTTKLVFRVFCFISERLEDGLWWVLRLSSGSTEYPESGGDWVSERCKDGFGPGGWSSVSRGRSENLGEDVGSSRVFAKDRWGFGSSERNTRILVGLLRSWRFGITPGPTSIWIDEDLELGIKHQVFVLSVNHNRVPWEFELPARPRQRMAGTAGNQNEKLASPWIRTF